VRALRRRPGGEREKRDLENQDQFEEVLGLQEVALESEAAWDDVEATDDFLSWGFLSWCRFTP
jgi:hypothetical protein